eukprot:s569_g18.t2
MDAGMHAARRLAAEWKVFYMTCSQGPGQRLGQTTFQCNPIEERAQARRYEVLHEEETSGNTAKRPQEAGGLERNKVAGNAAGGATASQKRPLDGAPSPPRKRLRGKQRAPDQCPPAAAEDTALDAVLEADEYILREWRASHGNPDPRAQADVALEGVGKHFRTKPTLPEWVASAPRETAFDMPEYACSLQGCDFESNSLEAFEDHICQKHGGELEPLAGNPSTKAKLVAAYRAGLTWACQQDAPTAHLAIDRRCLRQYREAQGDDAVGAAICFFCARRFPYTHGMGDRDQIQWKQLAEKTRLCGLSLEETKRWLSVDTYWNTYAVQHSPSVQERLKTELQDWCADVSLDGQIVSIICCPEDKVCYRRCPSGQICSACRGPVCVHCWQHLRAKQVSSLALANDMLVFYTPRLIYRQDVTFMELVCASPCFTAMACFSLEKKLLGDRALDQDAFMNRNRLVARGNATTFPLAWEDLLQNFQQASKEAAAGQIGLPKVGAELAAVVNVIIKAGGPLAETSDTTKIIHQARVRRAVVLQLIADAKAREHPAYNAVCMEEVIQRAEELPEDGVPAEIVAWLPHDADLDNLQRQKAATPVRAMLPHAELQAEFAHMCKPNAVVSERTSAGFSDANATHVAALQAAVEKTNLGNVQTQTAVAARQCIACRFPSLDALHGATM